MGHGHDHGGHGHDHGRSSTASGTTRAFALGIALNLVIVAAEVVAGIVAHSMALLADAGHNLGDVLGLVLAGGAALLARRKANHRRTYGYRRATLLSALANGVFLLVTTGALAWESLRRLAAPQPVDSRMVMIVAAVGVVVNSASAMLFYRDRERDLNVKGAFLHLAGDAAIALGVVVSAAVTSWTGWTWLDPATGILVALLILASTWSLLRHAVDLVMDAVPDNIDLEEVRAFLGGLPRVSDVHDLHVWAMSTTETALTAHIVMPDASCEPRFLTDVCKQLHDRFGIEHATLQVDPAEAVEACDLARPDCVRA
jgi:cobalt-zinc-cadmium efflux system protein